MRTKDDMNANGIDQEAVADVGEGANDRGSRGMSAPKALGSPLVIFRSDRSNAASLRHRQVRLEQSPQSPNVLIANDLS